MGPLSRTLIRNWDFPCKAAVNASSGLRSSLLPGHELALVVDEQMELEAKEPAHGAATTLGQTPENPVAARESLPWRHRCREEGSKW